MINSAENYAFAHKPKNPNFTKKELFKIAQMEPREAHGYIIEEYGRCEVNYFDYVMPEHIILQHWVWNCPWRPEDYQ